nr:oligosaccharide flippase family protein [uncultured Draconibacterium sp.]
MNPNSIIIRFISQLDIHTLEVLKKSSITSIVRGSGMMLNMVISIVLGRLLGPEGLGIINLSNQLAIVLLMIIMLGFPTAILKEVAIAHSRKNWDHVQSVIKTSFKINYSFAFIIVSSALLLIPFFVANIFEEPRLKTPLTIAITATLFQVASRIFAAGINGYGKIWQSSLVDQTLSLLVVFTGIGILYLLNLPVTIISIAWLYAIARAVVALTIGIYWRKIRPPSQQSNFIPKQLLKVALPLLFVQATNTIASSIDTVMIGTFLDAEAVGLYSVAIRIAFVSSFFLQVTSSVIGPKIASMYANNQIKELAQTITKVTTGLFSIALIFLIGIIIGGNQILNLWGLEFKNAYWPLIILTVGQFVAISSGATGSILSLCGQERSFGKLTLSSAIINVVLNIILIKLWGIAGAALATATTKIIINIVGIMLVKKRVGIYTLPSFKLKQQN